MLYEIECDKFARMINGKLVPRGRIEFHEGLNTVLGDKKAENSIGKSTFLLALDFCFGGDDYLNTEINNVVSFVGNHTIKFAFKFGNQIEWYTRDTLNASVVIVCDDNYQPVGETMPVDDFRKHLREAYQIQTAENSWRSLVGRYSRIYGRDNADERKPLKYGEETVELSIMALEQLFGVYSLVKEYEEYYKDKNKRKTVRKQATDIGEIVTIAKTKKQVKENEKEIERLTQELSELTDQEDSKIAAQDTANLDKASEIKGQITVLKRKRTRLVSQLNTVKANLEGGLTPTSDDIVELQEYFPEVDIEKLETIENFHKKIQTILTGEMTDEVSRLEILIAAATEEVTKLEDEQRKLGIPTHVSKKFLDKTVEFRGRISFLKKQNEGYNDTKALAAETKAAKEQMENAREDQLSKVETMINQNMIRLNDFIYDAERYAPEIHFGETRTGKPSYKFGCKWNTGTGENYKNLIIYDLSILNNTDLPYMMHDSLIFKNIADLPIDKIMQLYLQSKKQIFISFDKKEAFTEYTEKTVTNTTVIELYDDGGELFGWSWAKKKKAPETKKD